MTPITRGAIEILLDSPNERSYVVSAFADLTVKDGFRDFFKQDFENECKTAAAALSRAEAREALDENLEEVRRAVRDDVDPSARGAAVFVSKARGLRHVMALDFPVENRLVIGEDPFVLPLLERWHGEPSYLVAVVDSDRAEVFESRHGSIGESRVVERTDINADIQRDKPRFTYKKRFADTDHERLHAADEDPFLQDVAEALDRQWTEGDFQGLILLGQPDVQGAMRQLLPKDVAAAVVEEAAQAMTCKPGEVADDVARAMERWHSGRDARITGRLQERRQEDYLLASGPTDVLDALQQGRAAQVVCGRTRDLPGALCRDCGYRFGAPVATCPYCGGACRAVDAVQEILRMALKHRVPVHLFQRGPEADPLESAGGVAAFLRAEANWAPDKEMARASQGA